MPARVARIVLSPGRKLSEIVLFRDDGGEVATLAIDKSETDATLRTLMQTAGFWPLLQRRPFGGMPGPSEKPAAIIVMATDTRPFAPDPRRAIDGLTDEFNRGLSALAALTTGPVYVCQQPGPETFEKGLGEGRVKAVNCGPRHPQGAAGIRIHDLYPAAIDTPVWECHAEDVAALGALLMTGRLLMTRHVQVAGSALKTSRLVRTQIGADLRGLTRRIAMPGAHMLLSGSPLDGHEAHWLTPRHRQVTALTRPAPKRAPHWFIAAMTRSGGTRPVIPTAALTQAFGQQLPAAAFVRALSAGNDEAATKLGVLSLLEDDLALADYVLSGEADLRKTLRAMLDRIKTELAP
jgi:Na+-transporting NADH:ubiquinone oxidoreductase subunit A